jgi:Zinc knuckle
MTSRSSGPSRGKGPAPPTNPPTDPYVELPESDEESLTLDFKSQIMALQNAQVKQALAAEASQNKIGSLETSMQQILDLLKNNMTPTSQTPAQQTTNTESPDPLLEPTNPRASPALSGQSNEYFNYKPKVKDPLRFSNKDGPIQYHSWKQLIRDKFIKDQRQFNTPRDYMSYIFGRTEGDAQEHLYPRYTEDEENEDPYTSYQEMFETLDAIYKNAHQAQDSRHAYRELKMGSSQSFQDFKTKFIQLANEGRIPSSDRFDDMYEKMTTSLQGQLLNQLHTLDGDFNELCKVVTGIDSKLRRLNTRRNQEREARTVKALPAPTRTRPSLTPVQPKATPVYAPRPIIKPTGTGVSLLQRPITGPAPPTASESRPLTCFNCQRPGHFASDCPEPKRVGLKDIEEEDVAEFEQDIDEDDQGNDNA